MSNGICRKAWVGVDNFLRQPDFVFLGIFGLLFFGEIGGAKVGSETVLGLLWFETPLIFQTIRQFAYESGEK